MKFVFPSGREVEIEPIVRGANQERTKRRKPVPGFARKAWNYAVAVARWKAAGSPVRSEEEIARIFAICEACPHFANTKRPHCRLCGCSLNRSPDGLASKIAMSTEGCPAPTPLWVAEV